MWVFRVLTTTADVASEERHKLLATVQQLRHMLSQHLRFQDSLTYQIMIDLGQKNWHFSTGVGWLG